jgi:mycothiol synthase
LAPFQDSGMVLAQVLLESVSAAEENLLRQGGFDYLADLFYLVCPKSGYPGNAPIAPLRFDPEYSSDPARFARVVESTYHGTKDCPRLNDLRRIEDVLEGYQASGVFDPGRWFLVKHAEEDVGCLLLADHPAYDNLELVYMGIVPSARGRGWGKEIARFAEWQARLMGRARLILAVDASNRPAVQIYLAAGFQPWDRRRVYFKILSQE